jgi:hypothetical protein
MTEQKTDDIEQDFKRLEFLAQKQDKNIEELQEMGRLEVKFQEILKEPMEKIQEELQRALAGMRPSEQEKVQQQEQIEQNHAQTQQSILENKKRISEGITTPEAQEYVKALAKNNNSLKKENVLLKFENNALKDRTSNGLRNIQAEIDGFKMYLQSIQETSALFLNKLEQLVSAHQIVRTNDTSESKPQPN